MNDVCASVLLASGWLKPRQLAELPRHEWRPALIDAMARRGVGETRELKARLNSELALRVDIYQHLREAGIHPRELAGMGTAARREALLAELHERRGTPFRAMRDCDDRRLLDIASSERLSGRLGPLVDGLENVGRAAPVAYGLADDGGRPMDALKVLPQGSGDYLGIYHSRVGDAYRLQVARSNNLINWSRIAELGDHNHQGDISRLGGGYLVVNERDEPRRGNHLRFRYYGSLDRLAADQPHLDRDIPRTLSRWNEGTPDIRQVDGADPERSAILIGFHHYRRDGVIRKVDRLAAGVLSGFGHWTSWVDEPANQALAGLGFKGNFGGRCSFVWDDSTWLIQEAQLRWKDWSSWRVLLGNGRSFIRLVPRTPGASRSFANPCLARLPEGRYAAAFFLPHQGNIQGEEGELLYAFTVKPRG